jgi:hypothetical protein
MIEEGPHYHRAAEAAAAILSFHVDPSRPKAEQFGKILFTVLAAIYATEADRDASRFQHSNN